jgi:nicotinate-nucleotide adenylyltransferase
MTLPCAYARMHIGLMGGSFDPAHYGHAHVARVAAKRLGLHRIWWLVSPQNPLKPKSSPLAARLASARREAPPGVIVTDLESQLGLRFTADTLAALHKRYPGVRFVWIMGEDNMAGFHHWRRWPAIFRACPIFIVSRPTGGAKARMGPAFKRFAAARRPAGDLVKRAPPAWACQPARYQEISSTMLRDGARAARSAV